MDEQKKSRKNVIQSSITCAASDICSHFECFLKGRYCHDLRTKKFHIKNTRFRITTIQYFQKITNHAWSTVIVLKCLIAKVISFKTLYGI